MRRLRVRHTSVSEVERSCRYITGPAPALERLSTNGEDSCLRSIWLSVPTAVVGDTRITKKRGLSKYQIRKRLVATMPFRCLAQA
jgi:hypothetical protein